MTHANELSIRLPASVVEKASTIAQQRGCSVAEVLREALCRYDEFEQLLDGMKQGGDQRYALDEYVMEYANRMVHETRAEMAEKRAAAERKAS